MARTTSELAEHSWGLIDDAIRTGEFILESGKKILLDTEAIVRLVQWTATIKAKKPQGAPLPEDFKLKETTGGSDEKKS